MRARGFALLIAGTTSHLAGPRTSWCPTGGWSSTKAPGAGVLPGETATDRSEQSDDAEPASQWEFRPPPLAPCMFLWLRTMSARLSREANDLPARRARPTAHVRTRRRLVTAMIYLPMAAHPGPVEPRAGSMPCPGLARLPPFVLPL